MGRLLCAAMALGAASGCAQIAGIDETSGPPPGVSLRFERASIGATVVRAPLDLTGQMATFVLPDDTAADGLARVPGVQEGVDTWTAPVYRGTPDAIYTLPDQPWPRMLAVGQRDVVGLLGLLEHPGATPAPANATVTVSATLPSAYAGIGEQFEVYTVGTWTRQTVPPPMVVGAPTLGPFTYPYADVQRLTGRPLERFTAADAIAVLRYTGNTLSGVLDVPPVDQTGADAIDGTMVAVPADLTLDIVLEPAALPTRLTTMLPAMTSTTIAWAVRAAPGAELGIEFGPSLVGGVLTEASPTSLTATYGNPFAATGWRPVFRLAVEGRRTYTRAGMPPLSVDLLAGATHVADAATLTGALPVGLPAGMPQTISIDATPLTTDGVMIPRPVMAPVISFTADGASDTLFEIALLQLAPNTAGTALERTIVLSAVSTAPTFTIPPELLQPGAEYVIRAATVAGGFPGLGAGDLTQRSLPVSRAFCESGVFTVTP